MTEKWDVEYWCKLIGSIVVTSGENLVKENIILYISTGKTFLYISFLHFCIVLANYKYLLEERGEGDFLLYLHLRVMDRLGKVQQEFIKFTHPPTFDYKLDIFYIFVSRADIPSQLKTTLSLHSSMSPLHMWEAQRQSYWSEVYPYWWSSCGHFH